MQWKRLVDYFIGITTGVAIAALAIGLFLGNTLTAAASFLLILSTVSMFYTAPWGENP